ncbi:hypothetical protein PALB_33980 [Pseudoalteromonas luteoviolacea B = ATCC 29581]|nr:hypothetical protein PALB_33980 [Pseudoalteromonas luteoviolacea B = ATCC 29581]
MNYHKGERYARLFHRGIVSTPYSKANNKSLTALLNKPNK